MINTSELGLGNLVKPIKPRHGEQYLIVESIDTDEINSLFRPYKSEDIEPIPLTKEWLLKMGFLSLVRGSYIDKNQIILRKEKQGYSYERFTGMFVSIEFVHQLQNLIYILTNEELTLNN